MIKAESDLDYQMGVFKSYTLNLLLCLFILTFGSCSDSQDSSCKLLMEALQAHNDIQESRIAGLETFFNNKIKEEPIKYKEAAEKIMFVKNKYATLGNLKTDDLKKKAIPKLESDLKSIMESVEIIFISKNAYKLETSEFKSLLESDLNINLLRIYDQLYYNQASVF